MYRSSVRKFIHGVLSLMDEGRDLRFDQLGELHDFTLEEVLEKLCVDKTRTIRDGMPAEYWDEILAYVRRFTTAHGLQSLQFFNAPIKNSFLCWLVAIGAEMLGDI